MKLITIFEEIELDELQGVSFDARAWTPVLRSTIKISKNSFNPVIKGREYPKEYKSFPIDYLHFQVDPRYENGAMYDENKSGYDKNDQYHVYFVFGDQANQSSLNHELKHAFEDFKRMSKGRTPLRQTKEVINYFSGDFDKLMLSPRSMEHFEPFAFLITGLYYTSKIERSAYSETVYDEPVFAGVIKTIKGILREANSSYILFQHSRPSDFLEKKWAEFKENYHIPITDRFTNYEDFIKWSCNTIQYQGIKTIKKLQKVQYYGKESKKEGGK